MTYANYRRAHVADEVKRIYDFLHRGCAAQQAVDKVIAEANQWEGGQPDTPPEGGRKRLPSRSAGPRTKGKP